MDTNKSMVSFNTISEKTGIPLPSMFVQWLKDGLTHYENWEATWRKRMLESPPALASIYDFQWLTADQSQAAQEKWLNPDCQGGIRFLPFGRSGAGDCYSLIPVETDVLAVALIAHDSGKLVWCGRSFAEWVSITSAPTSWSQPITQRATAHLGNHLPRRKINRWPLDR